MRKLAFKLTAFGGFDFREIAEVVDILQLHVLSLRDIHQEVIAGPYSGIKILFSEI